MKDTITIDIDYAKDIHKVLENIQIKNMKSKMKFKALLYPILAVYVFFIMPSLTLLVWFFSSKKIDKVLDFTTKPIFWF